MAENENIDKDKAEEQANREIDLARRFWYAYLTGDESDLIVGRRMAMMRRVFRNLPTDPRCKVCNVPFGGMGGAAVRIFGWDRSNFNPGLCNQCEKTVKKYQVGTELQLTMLFADVRGSTTLAEQAGPSVFHHLINRYYRVSTEVLSKSDALINRLIGDALIALYVPGIAGPQHARVAVEAARALLRATGHADPAGPWIGVGIGVHMGMAYVGAVGSSDSVSDIAVLGDAANIAARLSSQAGVGEILVSEETSRAADLRLEDCEVRNLKLKGRDEPVAVRVVRVSA
jgi:adenylate cyclase